jgi:hypothetical protein
MRWLLADPQIPAERQWQQHVVSATQRWWQSLHANAANIGASFSRPGGFDLVRFMDESLGAIDPRLCWEFGPARNPENARSGGHRLVITPEGEYWLRPVVNYILSKAPAIPHWEFYGNRPPETVEHVRMTVKGRQGVEFQQAGVEARVGENRKIDLIYTFPQDRWPEKKAHEVAFQITETLMGDEVLDTWIGVIEVGDAREPGRRWLPLDRGQATVTSLIQSMVEQLPAQPLFRIDKDQQSWSNYSIEREEEFDDYPARSDVIVGSTCDVIMLEAALSPRFFDSRCHSRHQEYFCYLKIDAADVPRSERIEHRSSLEDPLDEALQSAGVGGSIGGASGIRYSYVDLSLTNVNQALGIVRQVLAQRRAPLRTWLLFFDSQFSREWAGVYSDTPPPPMAEEE